MYICIVIFDCNGTYFYEIEMSIVYNVVNKFIKLSINNCQLLSAYQICYIHSVNSVIQSNESFTPTMSAMATHSLFFKKMRYNFGLWLFNAVEQKIQIQIQKLPYVTYKFKINCVKSLGNTYCPNLEDTCECSGILFRFSISNTWHRAANAHFD